MFNKFAHMCEFFGRFGLLGGRLDSIEFRFGC